MSQPSYVPGPGFVEAYSTSTGEKRVVPAHYVDHPVLGRNLALTPRQRTNQTPPTVPAGGSTSPSGDTTSTTPKEK